jgi:hypothetical protein
VLTDDRGTYYFFFVFFFFFRFQQVAVLRSGYVAFVHVRCQQLPESMKVRGEKYTFKTVEATWEGSIVKMVLVRISTMVRQDQKITNKTLERTIPH